MKVGCWSFSNSCRGFVCLYISAYRGKELDARPSSQGVRMALEPLGCGLRGLFWEHRRLPHKLCLQLPCSFYLRYIRAKTSRAYSVSLSQACKGWDGRTPSYPKASGMMPPAPCLL